MERWGKSISLIEIVRRFAVLEEMVRWLNLEFGDRT
jgi:hypothetical protein